MPVSASPVRVFQGRPLPRAQLHVRLLVPAKGAFPGNWQQTLGPHDEFSGLFAWCPGFTSRQALMVEFRHPPCQCSLPLVGYAFGADIGDSMGPFGSIHPRNKRAVGAGQLCPCPQVRRRSIEGAKLQNISLLVLKKMNGTV